jgi:DNA invertase Pin-like site-specific DNA recombinase
MTACGYIRRSNGKESPISRTAQEASIIAAASLRGDTIGRWYVDWGRSGSDRTRPAFLEMLKGIESGQVTAVYAYDADRLARREATLHLLLDAAEEAGVPVIDGTGRDLSGRDRVVAGVMGVIDSEVLRKMRVRAQENADRRKARKDEDGPPPYGHRREWTGERWAFVVDGKRGARNITRVVDAYRRTRSLNATSRILNDAGIPADRGGAWHAASVSRVIDRNAPGLRDGAKGRGVRAAAKPRTLLRLLRCHCGQTMSPANSQRGATRWYCRNAVVGLHDGPQGISEARILPWVQEEAGRLITPAERISRATQADPEKQAKAQTLEAAIAAMRAAGLDVSEAEKQRDALLETPSIEVIDLPERIDWSVDPEVLNEGLRLLLTAVHLGPDLLPVRAEWRHPEWRSDMAR